MKADHEFSPGKSSVPWCRRWFVVWLLLASVMAGRAAQTNLLQLTQNTDTGYGTIRRTSHAVAQIKSCPVLSGVLLVVGRESAQALGMRGYQPDSIRHDRFFSSAWKPHYGRLFDCSVG